MMALWGCNEGGVQTNPDLALAQSPLEGKWTSDTSQGGISFSTTLELAAGGVANLTIKGNGSCSGTQTYLGGTWSATATMLTLGGNPSCSGTIMCTVMGFPVNLDCSSGADQSGSFTYTLAGNTLTLTAVTDGGMTVMVVYTRVP